MRIFSIAKKQTIVCEERTLYGLKELHNTIFKAMLRIVPVTARLHLATYITHTLQNININQSFSAGKPNDLLDFFVTDDLTVLTGSGLGGTSLINANVALDMEPAVLQDSAWPKEIRDDADQMNTVDRGHFLNMIKPETYPSSYPALHKIERMKESLRKYDIEDLDQKILSKLPLYVTFEDKLTNHVGVPQPKCTACGNCVGGCNVGSKNTLNMNYLPDAKAHGAEIFTEVRDYTLF